MQKINAYFSLSMLQRERAGEFGAPPTWEEIDWESLRLQIVGRLRKVIGLDNAEELAQEAIVRSLTRIGPRCSLQRLTVDTWQSVRQIQCEEIQRRQNEQNAATLPETVKSRTPTEFLRTSAAGAMRDRIRENQQIQKIAAYAIECLDCFLIERE